MNDSDDSVFQFKHTVKLQLESASNTSLLSAFPKMSVVLEELLYLGRDGFLIRIQPDFELLGRIRNNLTFLKLGRGPNGTNVVQLNENF